MVKEKLLISACFLYDGYKYDGTNNILDCIDKLKEKYDLIPICPEVYGGLSTPRIASEQLGDKVINKEGKDVTSNFINGARLSLQKCLDNNCKKALLKAKSPSCGYKKIYDGTFTRTIIDGNGVFVKMLLEHNISIYTENEIGELLDVCK